MKRTNQKSKWLQALAVALICSSFALISTKLSSQVSNPQAEGIVVNADVVTLCALIGKMQIITFSYYYDPAVSESRIFHPYAVGISKPGNLLLFGHQVGGYSKSAEERRGKIRGWRNFYVNQIENGVVKALASTPFDPVRPAKSAITNYICKVDTSTAMPEEAARSRPILPDPLGLPSRLPRLRAAASATPAAAPSPEIASPPPEIAQPQIAPSTTPTSKRSRDAPHLDHLTDTERGNQEGWMAIPYDRRPHRSIDWYRQQAPPRSQTPLPANESAPQ